MKPDQFLADLLEKPARLRALDLADAWSFLTPPAQVLLLGMGSSHYANLVAAARLRTGGVPAVAELASSDLLPAVSRDTLVIAVSASAGSAETVDAVDRLGVPFVALANHEGPLTERAARTVWMQAGEERGGVACRSFQHTLALLLALESHLVGVPLPPVARAAEATEDLLARADDWRPRLAELLLGPHGTHVVAPARRISSAYQSALMLREGPRLPAVGCETGDWSHVDVYLTKTTDYRMLLLGGSRWEPQLLDWTRQRGSTVVAVGASVAGVTDVLRYAHDDVDDVRLLTETLVGELLAAHAWLDAAGG
ncbi:SIS domain-containing protein [Nocardioides sp.]|uniref:SIS domain-containing protein n=1 Tax=Nocardioides sp. TaxID=35761 RepID=UPI002ED1F370